MTVIYYVSVIFEVECPINAILMACVGQSVAIDPARVGVLSRRGPACNTEGAAGRVGSGFVWPTRLPILVFDLLDPKGSPVAQALTDGGFAVTSCEESADPRFVDVGTFEAVVIVMTGPSRAGAQALKLCSDLRASGYRGAVVLAGTRQPSEGVDALGRGADDFVPRPIDASEVVARLRAVLRRTGVAAPIRWGEVEIDAGHRVASIRGRPLSLTGREYALLACLVEAAGAMVSRAQLLRDVWKRREDPRTNLIEVHVSRLREKLGMDSAMIETVRGVGYRLRVPSNANRT
jgi:DNA-binding response OmpR family regulator